MLLSTVVLLISVVLSASFTSTERDDATVPKLDYSQIKPKDVLLEELSQVEGIPAVDNISVWVDEVISTGAEISESVARWVMMRHYHDDNRWDSKGIAFFHHVMNKFGYVSVVKDVVDYSSTASLILEYLQAHKLKHFPHLHPWLRDAVDQCKGEHLARVYHFILPLLSDYSLNHPKVKSISANNFVWSWRGDKGRLMHSSRLSLKIALICYCLGAVELNTGFQPQLFTDIMIIRDVAQEFPEQMSNFISGLDENSKAFLEVLQSGQPPSVDVWKQQTSRLVEFEMYRYRSHLFDEQVPVLRGLIYHLLKNHREWIKEHWSELKTTDRIAFFLSHPECTNVEFLPEEMPSANVIVPFRPSPRFIPFYQTVIAKYGLDQMKRTVKDYYDMTMAKDDTKSLFQMIRLSDPQFQQTLTSLSFNKFITTLFYLLDYALFFEEDFITWIAFLFGTKDSSAWAQLTQQ